MLNIKSLLIFFQLFYWKTASTNIYNGKEFADHAQIAKSLNASCFFARPYHSWERGLNEHTNGLVRQYLPKKTDFSHISDKTVQHIAEKLNNRPRKILNYKTPMEVLMMQLPGP